MRIISRNSGDARLFHVVGNMNAGVEMGTPQSLSHPPSPLPANGLTFGPDCPGRCGRAGPLLDAGGRTRPPPRTAKAARASGKPPRRKVGLPGPGRADLGKPTRKIKGSGVSFLHASPKRNQFKTASPFRRP